jgi:hypothetical protein
MARPSRKAERAERGGGPAACDLLIRNAYVITMDERRTVYPSGAVAVTGNTIVAVGPEREVTKQVRARHVLDAPRCTPRAAQSPTIPRPSSISATSRTPTADGSTP